MRRVLIGVGIVGACLLCLVAGVVGLYAYVTRPVVDGARLGGGAVITVVTGHRGPVVIVAYLVALPDGDFALVDAGIDSAASNIDAVLQGLGKTRKSVQAILLTHGHDDHANGVAAFPEATVYGLVPDIEAVRRRRGRSGATGDTKAVGGGERLDLSGIQIEVFALPGHTQGSAAYLAHGVLFVGDAAQGMRDGTFGPNTMLSEDADSNVQSLTRLAELLQPRRQATRHVAFGHSGPLDGLDSLLAWDVAR
jgi:glyoxylase-like metal-dependent hydrolase (beta-lactamase superfamily II)